MPIPNTPAVSPSIRPPRRLRRRGVALVEYALVLTVVVLPSIAGVAIAGAKLFHDYRATRDHVVRSTP